VRWFRLGCFAVVALVTSVSALRAPVPEPLPDRAAEYATRLGISLDLSRVIYTEAMAAGVDPAIVYGLVAVESGFDPAAMGRFGGRGLVQIKLSTARAYEPDVTPVELMEPRMNLRLGLTHLKRETEHFGDWTSGLQAYNAGRARLERARRQGVEPARGYVARVSAAAEGLRS